VDAGSLPWSGGNRSGDSNGSGGGSTRESDTRAVAGGNAC
jgi:hypothetical protein